MNFLKVSKLPCKWHVISDLLLFAGNCNAHKQRYRDNSHFNTFYNPKSSGTDKNVTCYLILTFTGVLLPAEQTNLCVYAPLQVE